MKNADSASASKNIELPETVNREADKIENDLDAMLRLVDYIFFLKDEEGPPS